VPARVALLSLVFAAFVGCTPEPASTVEMRQTVVEIVDQGRAMAIEDAMAGVFGAVDPGDELSAIADAAEARATAVLACAKIERVDPFTLRLVFDAGNEPCALEEIVYAGALRVEYGRPDADALLTTLYYEPLTGDETTLDGFSQLTWGTDGSQRLVTEIRLDAPNQRQIELQSDRVLFRSAGELKVDGWRRWQTLMGRWEADLAGMYFDAGDPLPKVGLAAVATPFSHTVVLDFTRAGGDAQVRVNGGRRDRLFEVTEAGDVVDLGDG
jgi:hypothetical protein